ncbi:MAG: bile acid:sodium symporter family protein [Bacteroidota bacterium]
MKSFLNRFSFTLLIFLSAGLALAFPPLFLQIGDYQLKNLIVPLIQVIMFGMGTTMSISDFNFIMKSPKAVIVGLVCQFTIMPFMGYFLANAFEFSGEIAAGVILIGCSPSGLASNVMAYIAKANVALSITITSIATLMAPFITPTLMKLLAGEFIEIELLTMMIDVAKMVFLPITLGILVNKMFANHKEMLDKIMPKVSMAGIVIIISIITATGRKSILELGGTLVLCTLIHNLGGYFLGYWGARLMKLKEEDCRTVAIEVGMQNGGLASGIAVKMGKIGTVGLAAGLFGPIMNITGSVLATFWSKKPVNS